jgi:hypothetical protein
MTCDPTDAGVVGEGYRFGTRRVIGFETLAYLS